MGKRIGKYKVTKRESDLSLADGGQIVGDVKVNGHVISNGGAASGAAAGGSAAGSLESGGDDVTGVIDITTQLANTNTFTVTFGTAYESAPVCVVGGHTVGAAQLINYTVSTSTTALILTGTGNTGTGKVSYICIGT